MFKFTHAFLLLEMLVATAHGIPQSQADPISDVKALQGLVRDLPKRHGEQLEPSQNVISCRPSAVQQRKVAFFVGQSATIGPFTHNIDVIFDRVVTNIGSSYSVSTGRFTALVNATYQFSVTLAAHHAKKAHIRMLKNGVGIMDIWSVATPEWAPSSNVAILSLEAGDQVWLQLQTGASHVYGGTYTTFSGFLIFEN